MTRALGKVCLPAYSGNAAGFRQLDPQHRTLYGGIRRSQLCQLQTTGHLDGCFDRLSLDPAAYSISIMRTRYGHRKAISVKVRDE